MRGSPPKPMFLTYTMKPGSRTQWYILCTSYGSYCKLLYPGYFCAHCTEWENDIGKVWKEDDQQDSKTYTCQSNHTIAHFPTDKQTIWNLSKSFVVQDD